MHVELTLLIFRQWIRATFCGNFKQHWLNATKHNENISIFILYPYSMHTFCACRKYTSYFVPINQRYFSCACWTVFASCFTSNIFSFHCLLMLCPLHTLLVPFKLKVNINFYSFCAHILCTYFVHVEPALLYLYPLIRVTYFV